MLRRALLVLGIALLALGALATWGTIGELWELRQVRVYGQPLARTAQEDYATNPYWLEFFAR
jgi:hypothetical protein